MHAGENVEVHDPARTHCIACGSTSIRYWRSKSYAYSSRRHETSFHIYRCRDCGSGFLNPPPSDALLEQIYAYSGHGLQTPVSSRDILDRERDFPNSTLDADRIVRKAAAFATASGGNALDVGSGYGFYTKKLMECGYHTTSVNPGIYENEVFREICGHEPLPVYFQDFFTDVRFDIIVMSQVLEHMKSPVQAVRKVSNLLANGGVLACAVPNFRSFSVMLRGTGDNGCLWVPEHVNYFTATGLGRLISSCGIRVVHYEYITRLPCHKISRCLGLSGHGSFDRLLSAGVNGCGRLVDRFGFGICINMYAVKGE